MIRVLAILTAILAAPSPAWSAGEHEQLAYLESSLDASRDAIRLWQDGWTAVYSSSAIVYTALAIDANNSDDRTVSALGAVRAALAASLLTAHPHPGRAGADRIRDMEGATLQEKLAAAEEVLRESAHRTASKRRPTRHVRNILVNTAFGALVWAVGDRRDALPFTLTGIAGGEALLLTLPEQPRRDLAEYRRRFGAARATARSWSIGPAPGGFQLQFALKR
jgi:hypothetical protein